MTQYALVLAGIIGTLAMTLFTEVTWRLLNRPYHVVRTLSIMIEYGQLATIHRTPRPGYYMTGIILHYLIGVIFTYGFAFLVNNGLIDFSLLSALLYGVFLGIIAVAGWRIFLFVHKDNPPYSLPVYLSVIFVGHILLAIVMFCTLQVM